MSQPKQKLILTRNGTNRFCIVLQSEMAVGDIEWAQHLVRLNMYLDKIAPHIAAILEEPEKIK